MKAVLVLEDGTVFEGKAFGATGDSHGEVVFNTSMTGYQEILTDPSYCGEIVVMTYPLIGNYGINEQDLEAKRSYVRGFVVRENCDHPSNWRSKEKIEEFMQREGVIGISDVDTRALAKKLRSFGTMRGVIATSPFDIEELKIKVKEVPSLSGQNLVPTVTTEKIYNIPGSGPKVVVMDFGAKGNIVRSLENRGCDVTVVPAQTTAKEILEIKPDGIMLSNGPGDPKDVPYAIETVKELGKQNIPIFGICLGHQILGLSLGANTYKLKFGHRGANQPVKDLKTGQVYITSQNHGYAIDQENLGDLKIRVTHLNVNDNTVEGIEHEELPLFSVQYHPEASPGPKDSEYLFDKFLSLIK